MGARRSLVGLLPVVLVAAIAGCAFTPQPTVTRLPPAASGATAAPTVTIPSPSVVPASPSATSAPVVSSTPSDVPVAGDVVVCAEGESRSISGSEQSVRVEGSCAQLSVSGNALTVDATAARIGSLAIAGGRVRVDAAEIERLSVQGNDATVTSAGTIGSVDLSGDRTRVTAAGAISSAAVRGQDNTVSAGGGVGDSVIEGRGNQVG